MNKLFFRLFYRRGHGVHSPFVFNLITKVIEEKHPYYAFDYIERYFKTKDNYGRLLFRLVNYFGCDSTILIGSHPPQLCLYPAMASSKNRCYVFNNDKDIDKRARDFSTAHNLRNIHLGASISPSENKSWRLIVVNQTTDASVLSLIRDKSILIINNIRKDKDRQAYWERMQSHAKSHITIDMYNIGMILFDDNLPMKNYKTYYHYG